MDENKYSSQKKHLSETKKQLRVWVDVEKYSKFQNAVEENGTSIYSLINNFIDEYIDRHANSKKSC